MELLLAYKRIHDAHTLLHITETLPSAQSERVILEFIAPVSATVVFVIIGCIFLLSQQFR